MAEAEEINVVVITPERQVLEETVSALVVPAHDGELGVLRDRAALMCELGIGQLRYTKQGQTRRVFIDGGFAQVYDNRVTVLTSRAVPAEEITAELVKDAQAALDDERSRQRAVAADRARAQRRLSILRSLQSTR